MASTALARYWHTLRWLKPVQLYGRIWHAAHRPAPDLAPAPRRREARGVWRGCPRPRSLVAPRTLRFHGVERHLEGPAAWQAAEPDALWRYHAHYFEDLVADGAAARRDLQRELVIAWITENPPGQGVGWDAYPTSRRIVNWVAWALAGAPLDVTASHSLAVQTRWLARRVEHHLQGNHLWVNAAALVTAGAFFEGAEADAWREQGIALLERELAVQVLPDGGHFERSPMYHALVLEDLLGLIQLSRLMPGVFASATVAGWREAAARMLRWLVAMSHPDGGIALLNDAAFGVAPEPRALVEHAAALGVPAAGGPLPSALWLPDTGYARLGRGEAVLIADAAPIGPDFQPGHAHADTLSFELSLGARRVLVDSGTSTYAAGQERSRQRGTAAHNTVVVDGEDSSEVWSSFRVARRARVPGVELHEALDGVRLSASHDGYRRLPGRVVHHREWALSGEGLAVTDRLEGRYGRAEARFHFAPGAVLDWSCEGGVGRLEPSTWHPRFGESVPNQALVVSFEGPAVVTRFSWGR